MLSRSFALVSRHSALRTVLLLLTLIAFAAAPVAFAKSKGKKTPKPPKYPKYEKRMAKQQIQLMKKMIDQRQAAFSLATLGEAGTAPAPAPADGTVAPAVASPETTAKIHDFCTAYALRMSTEMDQLKQMLKTTHNITYTPRQPSVTDDEDEDTLAGLTGDEFTAALLDQLVGVHMRGIAFEKQTAKKGYLPEFRALADNALKLDIQEVAQIKAWIKFYDQALDEDEQD